MTKVVGATSSESSLVYVCDILQAAMAFYTFPLWLKCFAIYLSSLIIPVDVPQK